MRISVRLPLIIVGCALAAAVGVGYVAHQQAAHDIRDGFENELATVRDARQYALKRYFNIIREDLTLIA